MKKIFLTITAIWCTGFNLCAQQTGSNGKTQLIKSLEQTIFRYKATVGLAVYEPPPSLVCHECKLSQ
ncbi:MAG: hypothetical protein K1X81_00010 [Bacteroidia bacterium]|nr:hypothetical protein [Bacteroidia bacterium]